MLNAGYSLRGALLLIVILTLVLGCSGSSSDPTQPPDQDCASISDQEVSPGRALLGMFNIYIDPARGEISAAPARELLIHFNITGMVLPPHCNNCLDIDMLAWNPDTRILECAATLRNQYSIVAYDVRGILYSNDFGHELMNADAWTDLWDIPGGDFINPFKIYARFIAGHRFDVGAIHTEQYSVYIPEPPQLQAIQFAVDASWPGNCREPYEFFDYLQLETLYDTSEYPAKITINFKDWQNDQSEILLHAPEITGEEYIQFVHPAYDWELDIYNNAGAPAGDYKLLLVAKSANSGDTALYYYAPITIEEWDIPVTPVNVTPPWLNFSPVQVTVSGNYAYVGSGVNGLHIFDITDPVNPVWVSNVETSEYIKNIVIEGGLAYVTDGQGGLIIIDIDPPDSPTIMRRVDINNMTTDVALYNGYAIATCTNGLSVVDIDPPESANVVDFIDLPWVPHNIDVDGGYAYVGVSNEGLVIIDIDPLDEAYVVKTVKTSIDSHPDVEVADGYAYCVQFGKEFYVIDIDPPESAYVIFETTTTHFAQDITLDGEYAYVTGGSDLNIIDISIPESPSIIGILQLPGETRGSCRKGNYLFVGDREAGLHVVDIESIESPILITTAYTPGQADQVSVVDGYAYLANYNSGIYVIDVDPPGLASVVEIIEEEIDYCKAIFVDGGYAYVNSLTDGCYFFTIVDIAPLSTAEIVGQVTVSAGLNEIIVEDGYAYCIGGGDGLLIIDVDPIGDSHIVKTIETIDDPYDMVLDSGFAYITDFYYGLHIVDIDPIGDAFITKSIEVPENPQGVAVVDRHALVGTSYNGLCIADIDPVDSAHIVYSINMPWQCHDIAIKDNFAFVASSGELIMLDINPIESVSLIVSCPVPFSARSINIVGDSVYVSGQNWGNGGLCIFELQ